MTIKEAKEQYSESYDFLIKKGVLNKNETFPVNLSRDEHVGSSVDLIKIVADLLEGCNHKASTDKLTFLLQMKPEDTCMPETLKYLQADSLSLLQRVRVFIGERDLIEKCNK